MVIDDLLVICWILLLHWIQLCLLLTSSKSMFFELPVLIPLVLYLIWSVSADVSLNCISRILFKCSFLWLWENQYMVRGLIPLALHNFPLWFAQFQQKAPKIVLLTRFRSFIFWLWVNHFCLICGYLLVVYQSAQLNHTWSDFSCLLRVMISETRILFHFILVFISSTFMKQLACNVGIISLIRVFGLDI